MTADKGALMSGDEILAMIGSGVVIFVFGGRAAARYMMSPALGWPGAMRFAFLWAPLGCLALLFSALLRWASYDVRGSAIYLAFYMVMGLAWLSIAPWPAACLGLSARDDVVERRNPAACWACAGLLAALTLIYTGGNMGDGPGWWVVVFCAALGGAALYLPWLLAEPIVHFGESITVERDTATGVRFAVLLVATGAILGRAVAGDWESVEGTLRDFAAIAWPAALLWGLAVMMEMLLRPGAHRLPGGAFSAGAIPGLIYFAAAGAWLIHVGWWS